MESTVIYGINIFPNSWHLSFSQLLLGLHVFCSSVALGFLALGRAGFAVNHMDIVSRYAGILMGISNTYSWYIGWHYWSSPYWASGRLLEATKTDDSIQIF